ncbi:MAG: hypothetical protein E6R03_16285 [Hyphomicrobiaceae bacterium]|nr:MAG: hypothetical protein E6R03_16285 [Hyphomicrobiaceae bacterium]
MKTKKKKCVGCQESGKIMQAAAIREAKDARVAEVLQKYGAMGVLKLMSHYFARRHIKTGQDVFKEQSVLCRNFSDIVEGRLKKSLSEEDFAMIMQSHESDMKSVGIDQ